MDPHFVSPESVNLPAMVGAAPAGDGNATDEIRERSKT
jgi:hypothetical protein